MQAAEERVEIPGHEFSHSMELSYAEEFSVDYYEDGYKLITIEEEGKFLVVPEKGTVPEELGKDITILQQPLDHIYLVATSAMDLFRAVDGIENIRLSGTKEDGWYIQEAKDALASGDMVYAGKYNAPDYELILSEGCDLAVESTMIHHNPEVKEKLEQFGIPVLVERSSYESHPLGRTEWIKLYGAILNREENAEEVFREQAEKLERLSSEKNTGKTVAFFYINSVGAVNVRKSSDYVSKMIELAGGRYVPEDTGANDSAMSTMNMQMEEFYAKAKNADYIIYNSTIDGELSGFSELFAKSSLLKDFKAVKDGNVWCTGKNLFQESTGLGTMIEDIHAMLTEDSVEEFTYMHKIK
ncbi:MAG: ABC transporter substrate-binding protein [Eubacteriales bacterium]|nr:ABC transporter substrate-binding protein [Eubacteriales bacterium]